MVHVRRAGVLAAVVIALVQSNAAATASDIDDRTGELAGAYLSARVAALNHQFDLAARDLSELVREHPDEPHILTQALQAAVAAGERSLALEVAGRLEVVSPGIDDLAVNVLVIGDFLNRDIDGGIARYGNSSMDLNPSFKRILEAWSHADFGRFPDAGQVLDQVDETDHLISFVNFHRAMILVLEGRYADADAVLLSILQSESTVPVSLAGEILILRTQLLARQGKHAEAMQFSRTPSTRLTDLAVEQLELLNRRLTRGEPVPLDYVNNAAQGISKFFVETSESYQQNQDFGTALAHGRLAEFLDPANHVRDLHVAGILANLGSWGVAEREFSSVPSTDPLFKFAESGRSDALYQLGRKEEAFEALRSLAESPAGDLEVHMALGSLGRRESDYERALESYNSAVNLVKQRQDAAASDGDDWLAYYMRAITLFELDRWDDSRADFLQALESSENNPYVLNFLGYVMADKGEDLAEAERLIMRAVEKLPDNGAFVDSLGWVLYRQGRFAEALQQMELAIRLEPLDPVVMDHLGDVYWQVGRRREAEFQWQRALSYDNETTDEALIRQKLETGLGSVSLSESATTVATD